MPLKLTHEVIDRIDRIASLNLKGYTQRQIAAQLHVPLAQVALDLKKIRAGYEGRVIRKIEDRKRKQIAKIEQSTKAIWEIYELDHNPKVRLMAQRVLASFYELEAKIDGMITEKTPSGGADKAAKLFLELKQVSGNSENGNNGHKDLEMKREEADGDIGAEASPL